MKIILGYYSNNKKNGLGSIYFIKNKSYMISDYINDVNNDLILLVDENGNEMVSKLKEGKIPNPKPPSDHCKKSEKFKKLKQFYEEFSLNLKFINLHDLPKNACEFS
jgi:hypothetical protein